MSGHSAGILHALNSPRKGSEFRKWKESLDISRKTRTWVTANSLVLSMAGTQREAQSQRKLSKMLVDCGKL